MSVVSGIVLYSVLWMLVFLIAIPIRLQTQGDLGKVVPGTQAGAPEVHNLGRKAWITTLVAALLWAGLAWIIIGGLITLDDIDTRDWLMPQD
jgi:predicted secreted protein